LSNSALGIFRQDKRWNPEGGFHPLTWRHKKTFTLGQTTKIRTTIGLFKIFLKKNNPYPVPLLKCVTKEVTNLDDVVVRDMNNIIVARDSEGEKREYVFF
jgi:hypothetical protein